MAHPARPAVLVVVLAALVSAPLVAVPPAGAAVRSRGGDVGWLRVTRVVLRSLQPWIAALVEEALDAWPGCGGSPPPAPVEPPIQDPDYTP